MRFYQQQHRFYCGVDLHARSMYLCLLDAAGQTVLHQNYPADPRAFLEALAPYRDGLVVAVECMFACFWTAALCRRFCFWLLRALQRSAASDETDISKESGGKAPRSKSADPEDVFGAARVSQRGLARLPWRACPRFETTSLNRHPVLATTNHEKYRRSQTAIPVSRPENTARMKILEFSSPLSVQPLTRLAIDGFGSLLLVHQPSA